LIWLAAARPSILSSTLQKGCVADLRDVIEAELRDRYTLERELGEGGMARVWIATDVRHRRSVAVKVLRPELALSGVADRFLREVRVLAELQHPHILALLDSGSLPLTPGGDRICPFYVMPLVRGETLRARLTREGPLPIDAVNSITSQVAGALDYAHKRGVVHRDVKPENFLIADDQVYLADFGIASALEDAAGDRLTETGLTLGTPAYMSPEQASAERRIDGRSDQYSLACVVFEMLAGEPPFSGSTAQAIMAKRLSGPAPSIGVLRPSIPASAADAMARALSQAPADRFPTTGAFAAALATRTAAPGAPVPFRPAMRRAALAATVGLTLLLAAAWFNRSHTAVPSPGDSHNPSAVEYRKRADREFSAGTQAGTTAAEHLYSQAIALDSGYARAWNGLARAYVHAYNWAFVIPGVPRDSLLTRALRANDQAFVADSGLAMTWVTRAVVMRLVSPTAMTGRLNAVRRALQIDPNDADAWNEYAYNLAEADSLDAATEAWRRAVHLRPTFVETLSFLSVAHLWSRRFDSAMVWADSAIAMGPTNVQARHTAASAALGRGEPARAQLEYETAVRLGGPGPENVGSVAGLAIAHAESGDRAGARRLLLRADSEASQDKTFPVHSVLYLAEGWGALDEPDRAFAWLSRYEQPQELHFQLHLRHDREMDMLRKDPRFLALLAQAGR
jgi:serine/threonine protein kinase/Flp pilus assembly protein TadD